MLVRVYKNLHRNCYSVQTKVYDPAKRSYRWLVTEYRKAISLDNPRFIVREQGRLRVIESGRKNVHAMVEGEIGFFDMSCYNQLAHMKINYNPKVDKFFNINGIDCNMLRIDKVYLTPGGVFV